MLPFSGSDPTMRDEVLSRIDVKPPKAFPKKAQLRRLSKDFGGTVLAAAGLAAVIMLSGTDTGLRIPVEEEPARESSSEWPSAYPVAPERSTWPDPSQNAFVSLAQDDPEALAAWIAADVLTEAQLSFAAEALGEHGGEAFAGTLLDLLRHESPLVREGAVYGLANMRNETTIVRLRALASDDSSPGVRAAANDVLSA